jgi:hypothetical protein
MADRSSGTDVTWMRWKANRVPRGDQLAALFSSWSASGVSARASVAGVLTHSRLLRVVPSALSCARLNTMASAARTGVGVAATTGNAQTMVAMAAKQADACIGFPMEVCVRSARVSFAPCLQGEVKNRANDTARVVAPVGQA